MKKIATLALAGLLLSSLAVSASASADGAQKCVVPKAADGLVITVDGKMDTAYEQCDTIMIDQFNSGSETGTYGEAKMLWADGSFYLFVHVHDADIQVPTEDMQLNTPWNTDSVEMFFDFGNENAGDIHQFRVDFSGFPSYYLNNSGDVQAYGPEAADPYFDDYAARIDDDGLGYCIEMRVSFETIKVELKEGDAIGLQLQINDMTADNESGTTAVYNMASSLEATSWASDSYDYVTLGAPVDLTQVDAEELTEEAAAEIYGEEEEVVVEDTPVDAPATADAGVAVAAALMAAAAGVVLSKKH